MYVYSLQINRGFLKKNMHTICTMQYILLGKENKFILLGNNTIPIHSIYF
jgi:hypothetical protein